jgi:DNA-binding NtrC family response regulator
MSAQRPRLLLVDADRASVTLIGTMAAEAGFDVHATAHLTDAVDHLWRRPVEMVFCNLRMPGGSGFSVMRAVHDVQPRARVVLLSDDATAGHPVRAIRLGAVDYLTSPIDVERLRSLLNAAVGESAARRTLLMLEAEIAQRLEFCGMVGRTAAMQQTFDLIRRLAPHARTALITGEAGTGKKMAARALHQSGPRAAAPFLSIDCADKVDTLLESELFGHAAGAFDGATVDRAGVFETADGGTVLLDNIGALPAATQVKLLAVLERGEVQRVGSIQLRSVVAAIVATADRDLRDDVAAGRFHADLYEQFSVAEIALPSLRDRVEDVLYLCAAFIQRCAQRYDKAVSALTPAAEHMLLTTRWAGNVGQLRSVVERACMLAEGAFITERDLADAMSRHGASRERISASRRSAGHRPPADLPGSLIDVEREHIARTLDMANGNKAVAARLLGVSRRALYRQLERHGLHARVPSLRRVAPAVLVQTS